MTNEMGQQVYDSDGRPRYRCGFRVGGGIDQDPALSPQGYPDNVCLCIWILNNCDGFLWIFATWWSIDFNVAVVNMCLSAGQCGRSKIIKSGRSNAKMARNWPSELLMANGNASMTAICLDNISPLTGYIWSLEVSLLKCITKVIGHGKKCQSSGSVLEPRAIN